MWTNSNPTEFGQSLWLLGWGYECLGVSGKGVNEDKDVNILIHFGRLYCAQVAGVHSHVGV